MNQEVYMIHWTLPGNFFHFILKIVYLKFLPKLKANFISVDSMKSNDHIMKISVSNFLFSYEYKYMCINIINFGFHFTRYWHYFLNFSSMRLLNLSFTILGLKSFSFLCLCSEAVYSGFSSYFLISKEWNSYYLPPHLKEIHGLPS